MSLFIPKDVIGNPFKNEYLRKLAQEMGKDNPSILPVYSFFENYVNELLPLTPKEQKKRLEEELAMIEKGKLSNLNTAQDTLSLIISNQNMRYTVCIKNEDIVLIEMSFPMSCELISGLNKLEMEELFINQLKNISVDKIEKDDTKRSDLEKTAIPQYFIKKGSSYHIPSLRSDLYYRNTDDKLELVASADHFAESVANIMMSEHTIGEYLLDLDVRKYGFKKETINTTIKNWIAYYKAHGCDSYFGIEEISGDELRATVFITNQDFKYNHILNITVSAQILEEKKGTIKGSVNVYIPTHNILDLLETYSKNSKRKKEKGKEI